MRVLVDAHHIGTRATGNETWAVEVAKGMARAVERSDDDDELLFAVATDAGRTTVAPGVGVSIRGGSWGRLLVDLPRAARQARVDVVLVQYTVPLSAAPCVVAIHDLSFTDPESRRWIPRAERARMGATIRWSAGRAGRILALSEYTSKDLQDRWGIDPQRIVVAHPAVASDRSARLRRPPGVGGTRTDGPMTVLAVGNVLPRKNLLVLARAVRTLRQRGLDVMLRLAGQVPPAGTSIRHELDRIGGEWLSVSGYLDETELVAAYHAADVFCFPSLYEGFGLPVLEAMTAGVPTVVSDATALPEAAGGAGALADPHDPTVWADILEQILTDEQVADRMRTAGCARAAQFSWNDTADRVLDTLRAVAS